MKKALLDLGSNTMRLSVYQLDEENKGRADFYICVPEDMTSTY